MPEINKSNLSKLCEEKGELLSKVLRNRILEQDFMRKSKFPIIYASEVILRYHVEKTDRSSKESLREFVQGLFYSSVSEESIAGVSALVGNHARELRDLKDGQEKTLEGYAIAMDSFTLVRIEYRIWAEKCEDHYILVAAGIRGVLDVKRTEWNDFQNAYMKVLNLGFPEDILQEEKQKQITKCMKKARILFKLFRGEIIKEVNKMVCNYTR